MTDHAELRRLAEAATPGPWTLYVPEDYQGPEELPGYGVECAEGRAIVWGALEPETGCQFDRDAEFIAAANPNTILALLDEIDQLKAENCAHKDTQKHCELLEQYLKECASALPGTYYMDPPDGGNVSIPEQIRRMAKDAARYRWLRERDLETIRQGGVFAGMTPENIVLNQEDLDAEIDAALEGETQ
ncbi:ead/Ea22-like family protein [Pseudomonas aeruginosa]|uniref:ead/Ea22-like family protein n=1 Tax=Pseudomonas aeruginosa TaxID=287 RepID=UPI00053EDD23|nr:ead/Ea22-like family protein [Pseudomonas aeruginosa]EKU9103193.1 ead/Ea22-like family protein [Pseudomonas aeruginosa]MCO1977473.1 ead/Ea22-like family protein [Pseudomonas aeruginosa]MCO2501795.1 ead/Ea22-like family protein [Pseudomonas aeruginosa]HCI2757580.1 ead/Ea22-like family protein [Pseudomonas aeruginosa]